MSTTTEGFAEALRAGRSRSDVISEMKRRDLTIIEAIKTARELFGITLGEAKQLVSSHPDWKQTAAAAGPLHEEIIQAFDDADADNGSKVTNPQNQTHSGP
jgi:ribosomal protein L7/L12